jgi:hypothetical protein
MVRLRHRQIPRGSDHSELHFTSGRRNASRPQFGISMKSPSSFFLAFHDRRQAHKLPGRESQSFHPSAVTRHPSRPPIFTFQLSQHLPRNFILSHRSVILCTVRFQAQSRKTHSIFNLLAFAYIFDVWIYLSTAISIIMFASMLYCDISILCTHS